MGARAAWRSAMLAGGALLVGVIPHGAAAGMGTIYSFPSTFQAVVEFPMLGAELELQGGGGTVVNRSELLTDSNGNHYFETEIIQLDLIGTHPLLGPVHITQAPWARTLGRINNAQLDDRGNFLSGDSFFDVFFVMQSPGLMPFVRDGRVWNPPNMPFRVQNHITKLPPDLDDPYYHTGPPVPLGGLPPSPAPASNPVFVALAKAGGHKVLPPLGSGVEYHEIILTVTGRPDQTTANCFFGVVTLHASDASSPPHTIMSVVTQSIAATGGATAATGPWGDPEGDGVFASRAVNTGATCVSVTATATATFTDSHTATATITFFQRN